MLSMVFQKYYHLLNIIKNHLIAEINHIKLIYILFKKVWIIRIKMKSRDVVKTCHPYPIAKNCALIGFKLYPNPN